MASLAFARTAAPIIVDGKGHLLGRLASTLAKQILNGQKVAPLPPFPDSRSRRSPHHNDQRLMLSLFLCLVWVSCVLLGMGSCWDLCGTLDSWCGRVNSGWNETGHRCPM